MGICDSKVSRTPSHDNYLLAQIAQPVPHRSLQPQLPAASAVPNSDGAREPQRQPASHLPNAPAAARSRLGLDTSAIQSPAAQNASARKALKILSDFEEEIIEHQDTPIQKAEINGKIATRLYYKHIPPEIFKAMAEELSAAHFPEYKSDDKPVSHEAFIRSLARSSARDPTSRHPGRPGVNLATLVTGLHYFDRFQDLMNDGERRTVTVRAPDPAETSPLCDKDIFLRRLFTSCVALASKQNNDSTPKNRSWVRDEKHASAAIKQESALRREGNELRNFNLVEGQLLSSFGYDLNVPPHALLSRINALKQRIDIPVVAE